MIEGCRQGCRDFFIILLTFWWGMVEFKAGEVEIKVWVGCFYMRQEDYDETCTGCNSGFNCVW